MRDILGYFLISNSNKKQAYFLFGIITVLYFINFSANDIFTPNESFYAESVREMFESGDFLDIKYNYEPRYNKPPLTYWAIALSTRVFGMNEFGIRFPIVLMALGSIWLTFLLGRKLYGNKGGIYAMMMMAVSVQFIFVKQYASPEVPLTFFFVLTLYWFIKGYLEHNSKYILLSYVALGLTVLTKGFPYIIVIAGIIGLHVIIDTGLKKEQLWSKIKLLKLHLGIPIFSIIGLSWVVYMYLKDGNDFWLVYKAETFDRALSKSNKGPDPFFYLGVIAWSIAPYSLAFYYALVKRLKSFNGIKEMSFAFSWFIVMLVIFTLAKGKIPTYIIQAHPAMILIMAPLLLDYKPNKKAWRNLWDFTLFFPSILILGVSIFMIIALNMSLLFILIPIAIIGLIIAICYKNSKDATVIIPFWAMVSFLLVFAFYIPKMEEFRPYDKIGDVIEHNAIASDIPIHIEATLIHNIPFYAKRYAIRDASITSIKEFDGPKLALVKNKAFNSMEGYESLWSGWIYDFSSESQFFKFVMACRDADNGDYSKFAKYHLIFQP